MQKRTVWDFTISETTMWIKLNILVARIPICQMILWLSDRCEGKANIKFLGGSRTNIEWFLMNMVSFRLSSGIYHAKYVYTAQNFAVLLWNFAVTPLAGVWIEIIAADWQDTHKCGHSPRGSVDWNHKVHPQKRGVPGHSPRGSVDWNITLRKKHGMTPWSLPSRECGLKSQSQP